MTEKQLHQFRKRLLSWFNKNQRSLPWRNVKNPYHTWIAEVMLQQTRVKKVLDYYQKFIDQFPDVHSLSKANLQQILKAWEGMGYYARARNLHKAAQIVVAEKKGVIPNNYYDFKKLPGAGEYITAAVLSQAFNAPFAVVDGNVTRVISRLFLIDLRINLSSSRIIFQEHADMLLDQQQPGAFNQAMMELGATICRPKNPQCGVCPINIFCNAFKTNQQNEYPVANKSKPIPEFHIAVGIIHRNGQFLITQRQINGLLGGMWEFPGGRVNQGESAAQVCIRKIKEKINLNVEVDRFLTKINHAYTHFKIMLDAFDCRFQSGTIFLNGPADYRWISASEIDSFPVHAAHHKIIPLLKKNNK
jgi:A/G-specific adenine glycosylase